MKLIISDGRSISKQAISGLFMSLLVAFLIAVLVAVFLLLVKTWFGALCLGLALLAVVGYAILFIVRAIFFGLVDLWFYSQKQP